VLESNVHVVDDAQISHGGVMVPRSYWALARRGVEA